MRGIGLLIGVALDADRISVPEGKTAAATVVGALLDAGLLAPAAGPATVRLLPPLNITQAEADEALAILRRVLDALS